MERPEVNDIELPWQAPDTAAIPDTETGRLIRYGRDLIAHTTRYLGPEGSVARISNGLNCQNCHLDAGTRLWGNNFGAVSATYPKLRNRSGMTESIVKRVNDCFERSMNGTPPDSGSREMQAMIAYMQWLGKGVPKGKQPLGSGQIKLPYLDRAADPEKGKRVYIEKCQLCHGADGQGQRDPLGNGYLYPPLWGPESYNTGAGLYRLSGFASFAKHNMPFGVTFQSAELSDEEAWDVAAYVNSQPRPSKEFDADWPDLSKKPIDHPFGPYADSFSERQHKYGPFGPIAEARKGGQR